MRLSVTAALIWRKRRLRRRMSQTRAQPPRRRGSQADMTRAHAHPDDPRALIAEAYRIEGLGMADARAIFFDWALGLPAGVEPAAAAARLLDHHAGMPAEHPMSRLLTEATGEAARPRRKGGVRGGRRMPREGEGG